MSKIKRMGFKSIELTYLHSGTVIDEIQSLKQRGEIEVVSVHNFCPWPPEFNNKPYSEITNPYLLSSLDEVIRKKAVSFTKVTIDTAYKMNAKAVVIHAGQVGEFVWPKVKSAKLLKLCEERRKNGKKYARLRKEVIISRQKNRKPYLDATIKSLSEINIYAQESGVKLGIENRYIYEQIPDFQEIAEILSYFKNSNIYYWHDVGHAQVQENMDLVSHEAFLRKYWKKMIGIHLHDIRSVGDDHYAPGMGNMNFSMIKKYMRSGIIKVLEVHDPCSAKEIIGGRQLLREVGIN